MKTKITIVAVIVLLFVGGLTTVAMWRWIIDTDQSAEPEQIANPRLQRSQPVEDHPADDPAISAAPLQENEVPIRAETHDFFRPIDTLTLDDQRRAEQAASFVATDYYGSNVFIRWNPVLINNGLGFLEIPGDTDEGDPLPKRTIQLTPFPGTTVVAENTYFRDSGLGLVWRGRIISGGTGWVAVKLIRGTDEPDAVIVNISSDNGAFRIEPTRQRPYYVALQHNPDRVHKTLD